MTTTFPLPYPNADAPGEDLIARCVHCGFCLPTCPTFAVLGVEMDSPRGRIRLMKTVWERRLGADAAGFDDHISNVSIAARARRPALRASNTESWSRGP